MGLRLRLRAGYGLAGFHGEALIVLEALERYGLIVVDNGSPCSIARAPARCAETPDRQTDDAQLPELGS